MLPVKFLLLCVGAAVLSGCQESVTAKPTEPVRAEALKSALTTAEQLKSEGLTLAGPAPVDGDREAELPAALSVVSSERFKRVEALLETYIIAAQEITGQGKARPPKIEDREKYQNSLKRANKYLGQMYAQHFDSASHVIINKDVDYQEYSARLARWSQALKLLSKYNLGGFDLSSDQVMVSKLSRGTLSELYQAVLQATEDIPLMSQLGRRNDFWGMHGLKIYADNEADFVNYYEALQGLFSNAFAVSKVH